jgi:hypothetical protein
MATIHLSLGGVGGGGNSVYQTPRTSAVITTSGSNQALGATAEGNEYARVKCIGGSVYVAISKTAASAPRFLLSDGDVLDVGPLKTGDAINVIDFS